MSRPYTIPPARIGLLDRVMPCGQSWAWLWRLRYALFGRSKIINLDSTIIDLTGSDFSDLANLVPPKPDFVGPDGIQIWRLSQDDLHALKKRLVGGSPERIVASPRVTTADKTQCQIFCGNAPLISGMTKQVGVTVDLLPCLRMKTIDLTTVFCFSEAITNSINAHDPAVVSVRTNFDFGGRFQLSQELSGLFVLSPSPWSTNEKRIAFLLTSKVQR